MPFPLFLLNQHLASFHPPSRSTPPLSNLSLFSPLPPSCYLLHRAISLISSSSLLCHLQPFSSLHHHYLLQRSHHKITPLHHLPRISAVFRCSTAATTTSFHLNASKLPSRKCAHTSIDRPTLTPSFLSATTHSRTPLLLHRLTTLLSPSASSPFSHAKHKPSTTAPSHNHHCSAASPPYLRRAAPCSSTPSAPTHTISFSIQSQLTHPLRTHTQQPYLSELHSSSNRHPFHLPNSIHPPISNRHHHVSSLLLHHSLFQFAATSPLFQFAASLS